MPSSFAQVCIVLRRCIGAANNPHIYLYNGSNHYLKRKLRELNPRWVFNPECFSKASRQTDIRLTSNTIIYRCLILGYSLNSTKLCSTLNITSLSSNIVSVIFPSDFNNKLFLALYNNSLVSFNKLI